MGSCKVSSRILLVILIYFYTCQNGANGNKIDPRVQQKLDNGENPDVIVECPKSQSPETTNLVDQLTKQISATSKNPATTHSNRLTELVDQLQSEVINFLGPVCDVLDAIGHPCEFLWISFEVFIPRITREIISKLVELEIVRLIRPDPVMPRIPPQPPRNHPPSPPNTPWNIDLLNARCSDIECFGEGVIVGFIDTGARPTHVEIADNWIGKHTKFGYMDGSLQHCTADDWNGHGTHVVGSAVGQNVGVAPKAEWMMCRACFEDGCTESAQKICAIWLYCPYDCNDKKREKQSKNCANRPQVISNSWGCGPDEVNEFQFYFFYEYIEHWNSVGITAVFAAGNIGIGCTTIGYPASYQNVITVGAVDFKVRLGSFSSVGPSMTTKPLRKDDIAVGISSSVSCGNNNKTIALIKPTVVGPGVDITSAWNTNDTALETISGTSMATPHIAGVIALMICAKDPKVVWSNKKSYENLVPTVDTSRIDLMGVRENKDNNIHKQTNLMCNVMISNICNTYSNNMYGFGLVDACKAVKAAKGIKP